MKNIVQMQKLLLGSVSAAAIGMLVGPALAQATTDQAVETVVVTGIRASLQSAQSIKQNADQVVDSITAVDIGALPDRSVAEALQRVPGVQITRTDQNRDPVRWAGYGNGVFVRGLSWVLALTNGIETFGAENGRTISFADVSSDLMAGVDVYKNPDAKMIEGGVGGTVDLRTRKPFDQDGMLIAASADLTTGDLDNKTVPSGNVLFSDRWNTKLGEVGALFSADYQDLRNSDDVYSLGDYSPFCFNATTSVQSTCSAYNTANPTTPIANGKDVELPYQNGMNAVSYRHMDWKQPRVALYGALQWRPTDKLEIGATVLWSKAEPQSIEHVVTWGLPFDTASLNSFQYSANGTWVGGTIPNAENVWGGQDTRFGARHHINGQYALDIKYNPTDNFAVTATLSYTDSRATMYDMTMYTKLIHNTWHNGTTWDLMYPNAPVVNVVNDFSGDTPTIGYTGDVAGMAVKSNYVWGAAMDHLENNYAHNYTARADMSYTFGENGAAGWLKSVNFGFRADLKQAVTRQSNWNWVGTSFQTWYVWTGLSDAALLSDVGNIATQGSTAAQNATELYKMSSFFGKELPSMWFPKASLLSGGEQALWSVFGSTQDGWKNSGTWAYPTWQPLAIKYACGNTVSYKCNTIYNNTTPSATSQSGGINDQTEDTYAGYAQFNYAHDTFLGADVPVDGNIGVRIVQTQDNSGPGYFLLPSVSACSSTHCTDVVQAYNFVGNSGNSMVLPGAAVTHTYTNVLPSFNFRAHLTDQLQARLAFSQQIVRPDFAFTQNYTSLGYNFVTTIDPSTTPPTTSTSFRGGTAGLTGSGGNPNLKPLHSNNYDVSLEWYFAPTGSLSFALFHKDISNYFMSGLEKDTYTRNGITENFYVTRYFNGNKGKVEGFELAYQQFYDSLPGAWGGLGLQANYTKIYNSGGANTSYNISDATALANAAAALPMEGMSNDSYNIAAMYEKYGVSARLAYNWRSGFLMTTSAANLNEPVWQRSFGQLDGSVFYSFMDHYKIGFQATNILKTQTVLQVGYASYHPNYEWVDADRKLSVILRANW
ncbi:MAG: TonB-dependent receptor [Alphaproteobacteria bacterium]|nr:TonB-dependent receptor [Alphaproteobacteria bacterium]MDE2492891.1 TonB-dependent receptor [Alphaproteobacteria bacterium]